MMRLPNKAQGFTLLEVILAITLLAMMMGMIYASLNVSLRAWDAGDARVTTASNWRLVERFLRRELGQVFPARWRGVATPVLAFEGNTNELRYVTALNLEATTQNGATAGLQWAHLQLASDGTLLLNRQPFDVQAQNFEGLDSTATTSSTSTNSTSASVPPVKLMEDVTALDIAYFGAETDTAEPAWREEWRDQSRLPLLIRLTIATSKGRDVPPLIVALRIGEEAGCLANNFVRQCGPRPR
jgi:general secretion pathway protein J